LNGSKVYLVGDSLGITNGITGFGINKSVESAELAVKCHQNGRSYSRKLTRSQITRSLKLNVLDKARRLFSLAKLQTAFPSKFRYNRLLEISVE
jgi:flavin-dependent dehydrogenase